MTNVPMQPASLDIWDKKYRLKDYRGRPIDETIDDTYERVATAIAEIEDAEKREYWKGRFLNAMKQGAIPAGRIVSNAGAHEYKPATSLINCTVSGTIIDSMDDIMRKAHEAALTLKAGCVAPGTRVLTEKGLVKVEQAVAERHERIMAFNREEGKFEFKRILRHLEVEVRKEENIRISSGYGSLTTSVKHPVLVWRDEQAIYVRADEVRTSDALVHHVPRTEKPSDWLNAWFAGAHLGDGSAHVFKKEYANTKRGQTWLEKSQAMGERLVFKMRAAEQKVVERYAEFFAGFADCEAKVAANYTLGGTAVWDFAVCSFGASKAINLVDQQVGPKSQTARVPEWVMSSPDHYAPFIAGVVDTDGTVAVSAKAVIISSSSKSFISDMAEMIRFLGHNVGLMEVVNKEHVVNGKTVIGGAHWRLKINDVDALRRISPFMADSAKKSKIDAIEKRSGQYDYFKVTEALRNAVLEISATASHLQRQKMRIYNGVHLSDVVPRSVLDKWESICPSLKGLIAQAKTLRPVSKVEREVEVGEGFYDFEVEDFNNYCAGNSALMVIHNCGIGYSFSTLRPRGAFVAGAGANTSGPMSFMDIFDKMCFTVASAGGRRGAQMGTFDVSHPDVRDFIKVKREDGRLRQFNLSLLIKDDFIKAVEANDEWKLVFPVHNKELADLDIDDPSQVVWREWPVTEGYTVREDGLVACKVYESIPARRLWDLIMSSTYDYAEPGFILIDKVNEENNNWWCENIQASNPCGEQMLPPYGSCLLGSVNLTSFVKNPFTNKAEFDWDAYKEAVRVFTRMLDNVVEINGLPLEQQRHEIINKRRHGMGYLGLGSAMTMLKIPYGSPKSVEFTEEVTKVMAIEGWKMALELSKEKGPAPILTEDFEVTAAMLRKRPEMAADGWKVGEKIRGSVLHARYSRYMQKVAAVEPELVAELAEVGARFTHHSSIAPTGTISLSLANNVSNGIEPSFAHHYARNVIREGKKTKEKVDVYSYELLAYRTLINAKAMPYSEDEEAKLPSYFISADDVTPKQHVDVQAAAQRWIDSSISKTANVPTDYPYEDFKDIYLYAYHQGLKGCTTFRFNPAAFQGVLVKETDLENTLYKFTLEDGSVVELKGNEEVWYDGETHTAANLFDALKEGYYGKF